MGRFYVVVAWQCPLSVFWVVFEHVPFHTLFGPKQSVMNRRNLNICILTRTKGSKRKREKSQQKKIQEATSSGGYGI